MYKYRTKIKYKDVQKIAYNYERLNPHVKFDAMTSCTLCAVQSNTKIHHLIKFNPIHIHAVRRTVTTKHKHTHSISDIIQNATKPIDFVQYCEALQYVVVTSRSIPDLWKQNILYAYSSILCVHLIETGLYNKRIIRSCEFSTGMIAVVISSTYKNTYFTY